MSKYPLPIALIALSTFCVAQAAHAGCNSMKENKGLVIKFKPRPSGQRAAVGASLSRAHEVAPYVRVEFGPELAELKNEPFDYDGGSVYYLESSDHGQRICRAEEWMRRESKLVGEAPPKNMHPAVKPVYPYFEMYKAHELQYDASGQLTSIQEIGSSSRRVTTFCALYDEKGRVEVASETSGLIVSDRPDFQCSRLRDQSPMSMTWYITYNIDGNLVSVISKEATRKAGENAYQEDTGLGTEATDGAWIASGYMYIDRAGQRREVAMSFHGSDKRGLMGVSDASHTIAPADATALFVERSQDNRNELSYRFPAERVPLEVATGLFEGITDYTRVREYRHRSHSRIFETFSPGAKHPRERQWRTLDLNRQENYDTSGKLTRVILSGPVSGDAYTENLRAYAEKGVLKLTPLTSGYSSYRVYDYDAAGKESLSFVCWRYEVSTNKPYAHFPWWEPDPRPKRSREAELQYGRTQVGTRCGTPDGKVIVEGMGPVKKLMETKYGFGTAKLGFPGE